MAFYINMIQVFQYFFPRKTHPCQKMTIFQVATSKSSSSSTSKLYQNQHENILKKLFLNKPKSFVFQWNIVQTFQNCTNNKRHPQLRPLQTFYSSIKQLEKYQIDPRSYPQCEDYFSSSKKATTEVLYFLSGIDQVCIKQLQTKIDTMQMVYVDLESTLASEGPLPSNKIQRMGCNKKWQEIITGEILLCWREKEDSSNQDGRLAPARKEGFHTTRKEDRAKG